MNIETKEQILCALTSGHLHTSNEHQHCESESGIGKAKHSHNFASVLREQGKSKLLFVLLLITVYMIASISIGLYTGSLALIADAAHMLTDVGAILLALFAFWFSAKPAHPGKTFGYYRTEILASIINAIFSLALSFFILFEAFCRIKNPPAVHPLPMLITASIGLIINIFCVRILHASSKHSHNVRAAYLEVLGDLFASAGIIFASLIMIFFNWYLIDTLISAAIGLFILPRTWLLLSECTNILMEGTPGHIDLSDLRNAILRTAGVVDVHDIHIWTITSGLDAMSGHVKIDWKSEADAVLTRLRHLIEKILASPIALFKSSNSLLIVFAEFKTS